ncbi:MAG: efflux RND transporter periplasmic adaptor subunit [Bacteroidetes bacterium]|jgi:membrane fusion protein, multidrug efflux system|nr:efflux RND transporter periplasmic adaptor subunit [Bacteroidota bacterium]MBT5531208.1 efflux RND transporter periplasmic adaptor subunit [Cytophagia bacterium]MBT3423243.1 efflux RND transporter periplasmic adaptor subunit [Bacteroidota bacterium]MBT3800212.1 efflux RND transporter periplasmic adaptor subunit [Bacteroidota bacterium]MBT3934315.1 efflux RND transporter periplasmic adaptor subunit [Bacteroidota bacterium]
MKTNNLKNTRKMKSFATIAIAALVLMASCSQPDKTAQLEKLKKEQADITLKIKTLEEEISSEGKVVEHTNLVPVKVANLAKQVFKHSFETQGNVESENNILVPAQSQTLVTAIYVKEGDRVSKGQLLAKSDGSILEKSIAALKVNVDLTNTIYEKQKRLYDQEIGSEIQYLSAKSSKEGLEKQMAALQEQLKLTRIISPINGTVDEVNLKVGESAMFGGIRVVQLSALKVKAAISEKYIASVHKGDEVKINFPDLDTIIYKKIESVSQVINPDNRTINIEFSLPSGIKDLKPNMISVLSITDYVNENASVVPQKIIQRKGDEEFLFVAEKDGDNWKAVRRIITIGQTQNGKAEVLSGLKTNDKLIIYGYQNLSDGQLVRVQKN